MNSRFHGNSVLSVSVQEESKINMPLRARGNKLSLKVVQVEVKGKADLSHHVGFGGPQNA